MKEPMFDWVGETWNPIAGGFIDRDGVRAACTYLCSYCYARAMINRFKWAKYEGEYRIHPPEMKRKFKPGATVFVCDMMDIGNPIIPPEVIIRIFQKIRDNPEVTFLLLTKNPQFYLNWRYKLPKNVILGVTIETDLDDVVNKVALAPLPFTRLRTIVEVRNLMPDARIMVSIEPIMKFTVLFSAWLKYAKPDFVAVGYDNHGHELDEPTLEETEQLITAIEAFSEVRRKTIRRAWNE